MVDEGTLRGIGRELADVVLVLSYVCRAIETAGGPTRPQIAAVLRGIHEKRTEEQRTGSLEMMIVALGREPGDPPPPPTWFKGVIDGGKEGEK